MGSSAAASSITPRSLTPEAVYNRLREAVFEQRLVPGTKLLEERLAATVGLSRAKVRQVLARLAHEQIVTLVPNRGAFVASPTVEEAREVFAARRLLEPGMLGLLCRTATPESIRRLREHTAMEAAARRENDRAKIIRLSGEFHLLLADLSGNRVLTRVMRELCAQVCLIIALYDKPNTPACPHHEHDDIIDALEAGDAEAASRAMVHHLDHIEGTLNLDREEEALVDLEAIFSIQ